MVNDFLRMPERVGVDHINVAIPGRPLTKEELQRWSDILTLSDAQEAFVLKEYERFVDRHNELMDRMVPTYLAESARLAESSIELNLEVINDMKALREHSLRLSRQIGHLEHEFIDSLAGVLSDEQFDHLDRLRHDAGKRQCETFRNTVRWADVDLRSFWESAIDSVHVDAHILQEVDLILRDHEVVQPPLVCAQAAAFWDRPILVTTAIVRHNLNEIDDTAFARAYRRAHRRYFDAGLRIRNHVQAAMGQITILVPPDVAGQFESEIKTWVYPEVYPDATDLNSLFRALASDDDLTSDLRTEFVSQHESYRSQHSILSRKMEAICLEWADGSAAGDARYHPKDLSDALVPILEAREALSERSFTTLLTMLDDDLIARYRDLIPAPFLTGQAAE